MVQVSQALKIRPGRQNPTEDAAWLLDVTLGEWAELEGDPDTWDGEQLDYAFDLVYEWPLVRQRFVELQVYAEASLIPSQRTSYAELLRLVEANKPKLERLTDTPLPLN